MEVVPMNAKLSPGATRQLAKRSPLATDPGRGVAIKRNVHEFQIDTGARRFADALREVMREPEGRFGLIQLKRPAERVGREFRVGERFHGCFSLERLVDSWFGNGRLGVARRLLGTLTRSRPARWLEDALMSDYAEIRAMDMAPGPGGAECYRVVYRYLTGSPIAGRSIYRVVPAGECTCRFEAVFEYQEVSTVAVAALHYFGVEHHDQVVAIQVRRAARLAGARVVRTTMQWIEEQR